MNKFFGIELERSESFYVAYLELQTVAHIAINHGPWVSIRVGLPEYQ